MENFVDACLGCYFQATPADLRIESVIEPYLLVINKRCGLFRGHVYRLINRLKVAETKVAETKVAKARLPKQTVALARSLEF